MGIKDLLSELAKHHPATNHTDVKLSIFKGHRLGIDIPIYAHKYMAIARKEAIKFIDPTFQDPNPDLIESIWLEKYFQLMMAFIECGITPVAVFDGPAFRLKKNTKDERSKTFQERKDAIRHQREHLQSDPDNEKIKARIATDLEYLLEFNSRNWERLETMLRTMGIPVLVGPYEAEAVCARLVRYGYTTATVTNDGDALPHGSTIMIRDVKRKYRGKTPNHQCNCIVLSQVLIELEMTMEQFVEFCMVLGTDYNARVKRHGFKTALNKYRKCDMDLQKLLDGAKDPDNELQNVDVREEIKGYFINDYEDAIPDHPLVVYYENGLRTCFEDFFSGFYRTKMLENAPEWIEKLINFNQEFARLQNFIPITEKDVNVNLKKIKWGEKSQ